ncbi:hypothetical protein LEN26_016619 [Aphanomyces euteiches]|nr:hypothetical protein LEN26_016619 [Aphanomyces euteiches]
MDSTHEDPSASTLDRFDTSTSQKQQGARLIIQAYPTISLYYFTVDHQSLGRFTEDNNIEWLRQMQLIHHVADHDAVEPAVLDEEALSHLFAGCAVDTTIDPMDDIDTHED